MLVHCMNAVARKWSASSMMNSKADDVKDERHLSVMRILQVNPNSTQRELAKRLGISLGGINYCLKALVDVGYVKAARFRRSKRKLGYAYILTPAGIRAKSKITARYLSRKMREHEALIAEIETLTRELQESKTQGG